MTVEPRRRITGPQRAVLAAELADKYRSGSSLRALAGDIGRSYGFVHRVLSEAGVRFRTRGGDRRTKSSQ